jgi:hypothetical protein
VDAGELTSEPTSKPRVPVSVPVGDVIGTQIGTHSQAISRPHKHWLESCSEPDIGLRVSCSAN